MEIDVNKYLKVEEVNGSNQRDKNVVRYGEPFLIKPVCDADEAFNRLRIIKKATYNLRVEINRVGVKSISPELVDLYEKLYDTMKKIESEEIIRIENGRCF